MTTLADGWVFYPNQLLGPLDAAGLPAGGEGITIPHIWKGMSDGGPGGAYGVGTYVRHIRLDGPAREFGLRPGKLRSVYHFYAVVPQAGEGGARVFDLGGNGKPGFEQEPNARGKLFHIPLNFDADDFYLVVQNSNHMHTHVGYLWAPVIGPRADVLEAHEFRIAIFWAFSGVVAATGLFTMFLALWHSGSNYYYMGGAILLVIAIRLLFVQNYIWIAFPDLPLTLAYRLEYIGIWVIMPTYYWLAYGLFRQEASKAVLIFAWAVCVTAVAITATQPVSVSVAIRDPYLWFSCLMWLLILSVFMRARNRDRDGATWATYGHVVVALGMIFDILIYIPVPKSSVEVIPVAGILFCVILMGLFTVRYRMEQRDKARLAVSLEVANDALRAHAERLTVAQNSAAAALDLKNSFLSNISHEVQTPLKAIVSFADLLIAQSHGPIDVERRREYLRLIRDNGENLLRLLGDILSVSDLESGRFDVTPSRTDPRTIVELALAVVEPVAHDKHILLDVRCESALITVDQRLMRQSLIKILSNAVKYSPVNGVVSVRGSAAGGDYVFTVTDTGPGIDEKDIPKAMALFGRVDDEAEAQGGGLGLGLPLVARFMELAGGDMRIDSIPDLGTTVTLSFPNQPPA